MADAKTLVIVTVKGGVIQSVAASDERVVVGVIDYDVDGSDTTTTVPQTDGASAEAHCYIECVSIEPGNVRALGTLLGMTVPADFSAEAETLSAAIDAACELEADKGVITAELDDLVTDAFNSLSAGVNNGGRAGQIQFLLEQGFSIADLRSTLGLGATKSPGPKA